MSGDRVSWSKITRSHDHTINTSEGSAMFRPVTRTMQFVIDIPLPAVWALLVQTDRLQRDSGAPLTTLTVQQRPDGQSFLHASMRQGPLTMTWEERPDEWVRERFFRHEHQF